MHDKHHGQQRFLTALELDQLHPVSRTTRWRMVQRGEFPPPIHISPGRVAWREADVRRWMEEQR
jgi:prophage regulatory protein